MKIDFLSHYGSEYYCPVSLLRVYGLTQIEEYKWEEWQTAWRREHEARGLRFLASEAAYVAASVEAVPYAESSTVVQFSSAYSVSTEDTTQVSTSTEVVDTPSSTVERSKVSPSESEMQAPSASPTIPPTPVIEDVETIVDHIMQHDVISSQSNETDGQQSTTHTAPPTTISTSSPATDANSTIPFNPPIASPSAAAEPDAVTISETSSSNSVILPQSLNTSETATTTTAGTSSTDIDLAQLNATAVAASPQGSSSSSTSSTSTRPKVVTVSSHSRPIASPSPGPGSAGSESIYRTIMNRLTVLESNSSLTVRYVEDQTRYAREALKRLEKDVGRLESLVRP